MEAGIDVDAVGDERFREAERRYAFADTHRMLAQRIGIFVNLPLASLDKLALKQRLEEIDTATAVATKEKA